MVIFRNVQIFGQEFFRALAVVSKDTKKMDIAISPRVFALVFGKFPMYHVDNDVERYKHDRYKKPKIMKTLALSELRRVAERSRMIRQKVNGKWSMSGFLGKYGMWQHRTAIASLARSV